MKGFFFFIRLERYKNNGKEEYLKIDCDMDLKKSK